VREWSLQTLNLLTRTIVDIHRGHWFQSHGNSDSNCWYEVSSTRDSCRCNIFQ
jgi:hypothetical protein